MDSEKILPDDMRIDSYLVDYPEEIMEELEEARAKNVLEDVLDLDIEFANMNSLKMFASLAYAINNHLVEGNDSRAYEAMYRGIVFASHVAVIVQGETASFDAGSYLTRIIGKPDGYDELISDTHLYLQGNEHVSNLLESYVDELDGGRGYQHLVEIAGALVFMLTERALAEQFLAEETNNLDMRNFSN